MKKSSVAAAMLALAAATPAAAQTATMFSGHTYQSLGVNAVAGSCFVGRGPSVFQRSGSASAAFITFEELWYDGRYDLSGQADLYFSTTNSGRIYFKGAWNWDPTIGSPKFTNYAQSYNAVSRRLNVSFSILLPNCTLHVSAIYDGA